MDSAQTTVLERIAATLVRIEAELQGLRLAAQHAAPAAAAPSSVGTPKALPLDQYRLNRRLVLAAFMCHQREVERAIDQGADINAAVEIGEEVYEDDSDWHQMVGADTRDEGLNHDSDPPYGSLTPLLAAIGTNASHFGSGVAKFLIRQGADCDVQNESFSFLVSRKTPLLLASTFRCFDLIEILLRKNARVDIVDSQQCTALHCACEYKAPVHIITALVGAHLDVNALTVSKKSPLMLSAKSGSAEAVKYLLTKGAVVDFADSQTFTALHYACMSGNHECISVLVEAQANVNAICTQNSWTTYSGNEPCPLLICCSLRLRDSVKLLLARGVDIDAVNGEGDTALIVASGERWGPKYYPPYVAAPTSQPPAETIIALLLDAFKHAAKVNMANKDKVTALHKSARFGDLAACTALVSYGGNLFAKDKNGETPIDVYGSEESFVSHSNRGARIKVPALSAADKAKHIEALLEARRVYLAAPLIIALRSGRILEHDSALPLPKAPPTTDGSARRRLLSNRDLIKVVTSWL